MPEISNPELVDTAKQLDALLADAESLVAGLDDEAFQWRPGPGRWSISECLEHLAVTLEIYAPGLENCIREARQKGLTGSGEPKRGWIMRWFLRSMEPPVTTRVRAPKAFRPERPGAKSEVYPRFVQRHRELGAAMADADGLDLRRNRMASPVLKLLKMSLGEAFALMLAHGRRHVWQAREVTREPGFPGKAAPTAAVTLSRPTPA
jgi:hypothetical protein